MKDFRGNKIKLHIVSGTQIGVLRMNLYSLVRHDKMSQAFTDELPGRSHSDVKKGALWNKV